MNWDCRFVDTFDCLKNTTWVHIGAIVLFVALCEFLAGEWRDKK